jgi:hypothetical protein
VKYAVLSANNCAILARMYDFVKPVDRLRVFWYDTRLLTSHGCARCGVHDQITRVLLTPGFFLAEITTSSCGR